MVSAVRLLEVGVRESYSTTTVLVRSPPANILSRSVSAVQTKMDLMDNLNFVMVEILSFVRRRTWSSTFPLSRLLEVAEVEVPLNRSMWVKVDAAVDPVEADPAR